MDILEVLAKMDERLARQDAILAKQDEHLAQLTAILVQMDARTERVAQYTIRSNGMLAEHTLLFERSMALLDRISQRLEAPTRP
jgi:hypothetical protein